MGPAESSNVGSSVPRVDGIAKVTGRAQYVDDLRVSGVLHGATVRSPCAHGVLRAIERDPDFDWSGVVLATAADIPCENAVALIEDDQPLLVPVGGTIRHRDEAVALVAAPTRARARAAAARIKLRVDPLPAVFGIEESLRGDVALWGEDNVYKEFCIRKGGDVEAAMVGADHIVEGEYRTPAQEQMYIEPQGMMGDTGTRTAPAHIIGSLQCPYYVHKAL